LLPNNRDALNAFFEQLNEYKFHFYLSPDEEGNLSHQEYRTIPYMECPETNAVRGRVYLRAQGLPLSKKLLIFDVAVSLVLAFNSSATSAPFFSFAVALSTLAPDSVSSLVLTLAVLFLFHWRFPLQL
jgi:hypothetical protein